MKLETRIEKLEKLTIKPINNPFDDWTDEELQKSIELLDKEYQTGLKQEWPEALAKKQAALPRTPCELDELSDEELEAKIARLQAEIQQ